MDENTSQPIVATVPSASQRGVLARIPLLGDLGAFVRFVMDRNASYWGKAFLVATIVYIVIPADAIPDLAPVVGWLDDLGLAVVALAYLNRVLARYRD
jgi:uncharacterized membrane protein YkvA (DUF1232 family)